MVRPPPTPPREKITLLAVALAVGIAAGWWPSRPFIWPWIAVGGSALLGAAMWRARRVALGLLVVATASLGAAWTTVRQHRVDANHLSALTGTEPTVVRVRGTALEPPVIRDRSAGSMTLFDHRPPATCFPVRVEAMVSRGGADRAARGRLLVRVQETVPPFAAGARVEVIGLLRPPAPPLNPGGFDYQRFARSRGYAGMLDVPRRDLVTVIDAPRGPWAFLVRWRQALRHRAGAWLLSNLPETDGTRRDALLAALLLGRRGPETDGLGESFRRIGLAHVLAISGLHLGVMAALVLAAVRVGGGHRRWHGWLVIGVVLGYLALIEVRMPVLRAGVMTIAACAGMAGGRRLRSSGLVATSAIGLLLWRPDELFSPGFQLSYGVVLGLIHLSPVTRRHLFGPPDAFAATSAQMAGQWLRTACAAALTAWAVATPITLFHWGVLWPMAAPFSVLVLPVVAVILAIGYLKMLLSVALPSAGLLVGVPLSFASDVLISLVQAMDAVPFTTVRIRAAPALWSVLAEAWICALAALAGRWHWGTRWRHRALWASGVGLCAWLAWPLVVSGPGAALRIDMLAVGDGSCYVLRSGAATVVFDAGSSSDLDAGRRTIVPALERIGVRSIDAIVISHPNLDHYSAVLELVDAFGVGEVMVTPLLVRRSVTDPAGPVRFLLDALSHRCVPVVEVGAGAQRRFGDASWTWLHPDPQATFADANDGSMVVAIDAAGRRVLLCGDIQEEAMKVLGDIHADIVELPHHGSFHTQAERFMAAVAPRVVLQSTAPARWHRTKAEWSETLRDTTWLITARDGACSITIDADGTVSHATFRASHDEGSGFGVQKDADGCPQGVHPDAERPRANLGEALASRTAQMA